MQDRYQYGFMKSPGGFRCSMRVAGTVVVTLAFAGICIAAQQRAVSKWVGVAGRQARPIEQLGECVKRARVVLLGEAHAFVEPIETLRLLLADTNGTGWTHIAFEWPVSDQAALDRYMEGDDLVLQRLRQVYGQLPGATKEYFDTFAFIRERNRANPARTMRVCALDVPHPVRNVAEEDRDGHMFKRIEALLESDPKHRVLVHCGDGHAARCGALGYRTRAGGKNSLATLGGLLSRRYPKKVLSVDVLSRYSPMWWQIKNEAPFEKAVVIPAAKRWPAASDLGLPTWHPDPTNITVNASEVFDYLVWWPTCTAAARGL